MGVKFNTGVLLKENSIVDLPQYFHVEESMFLSSLDFVHEINNEIRALNVGLYKTIQESDTEELLIESFQDFSDKVLQSIKKIVDFIKDKIDKFIAEMEKIKDDFIEKKKSEILSEFAKRKLSVKVENIMTPTSLIFDGRVPVLEPQVAMGAFDDIRKKVEIITMVNPRGLDSKSYENSIEGLNKMGERLNLISDNIRGAILGLSVDVSKDSYRDIIKKTFLGSDYDKTESDTIEYGRLQDAFDHLTSIRITIKKMKDAKKELDKYYTELHNKFRDKSVFVYIPHNKEDRANVSRLNTLLHKTYLKMGSVVVEMTNDHLLALTMKMDILKKYRHQERMICLRAMSVASKNEETSNGKEAVNASALDLFADNDILFEEKINDIHYNIFMINEMSSLYDLQFDIRSIMESVGYDLSNITSITEAGAIKAALDKLIAQISKMFGIFTTWLGKITKEDSKFLDSNRNLILGNDFKENTLKGTYPYNIHAMSKSDVPALYYDQMKDNLKSQEDFIKAEFPEYVSKMKDGVSFKDVVKTDFQGSDEKKDISTKDYDLKQVYQYCQDFSKEKGIYDIVKKDIASLQRSNNEAVKLIKNIDKNTSSSVKQEPVSASFTMEDFFGEVLTEAEINDTPEDKAISGNQEVPNSDNANKENNAVKDQAKSAIDKGDSPKEVSNNINTYFKICGEYLGAKLTVSRWAYIDYMKLLRWHVKQYTTDPATETDTKDSETSDKPDTNNSVSDEPIDITSTEVK